MSPLEVNLRNPLDVGEKARSVGFETQLRRHQKSKAGIPLVPEKNIKKSLH